MVHLVGIGEFSVGRFVCCRFSFTESTLTALYLRNCNESRTNQNTPRNPQQPGDHDHLKTSRDERRPTR